MDGELIPHVSQLYPVLLAPLYRGSLVPEALHDAHVLNAFLITSAAVPAYLLARSVTRSAPLAALVALLSVCIPWLVYATLLLTEVVGYPAGVWAVLAVHRAVASPRPRNDLLALLAVAVAALARTQLFVLAAVLPVAVVTAQLALGARGDGPVLARLRAGARRLVYDHRVLTVAYGALILGAIVVAVGGRASLGLGVYASTAEGDLLPAGILRSLTEHLAAVCLGLGVIPFVLATGWMVARLARPQDPERTAFAAVALVTLLAFALEVTSFDLRYVGQEVSDRYLFYVVPVVLVALATAARRPAVAPLVAGAAGARARARLLRPRAPGVREAARRQAAGARVRVARARGGGRLADGGARRARGGDARRRGPARAGLAPARGGGRWPSRSRR